MASHRNHHQRRKKRMKMIKKIFKKFFFEQAKPPPPLHTYNVLDLPLDVGRSKSYSDFFFFLDEMKMGAALA